MWRRHSIAARKAAWDVGKSKIYAMMSKLIQLAAKKGADPKMNPSLELVLQKARYNSVPRDIVERAILKGSWQLEGEQLEEIFYEWYGPGGSALVIKTLTSNSNRTSTSVKTILNKFWWSLGQVGSVAWQFDERWVIISDGKLKKEIIKGNEVETILPLNQEEIETQLLELAIEDISIENWTAVIFTKKTDFAEVSKGMDQLWYHIIESDLQFIAQNEMSLSWEDLTQLNTLIEVLENDEDVDKVWTNVN
jgi:YebC/PmpR family DNA-binding regulatory protein